MIKELAAVAAIILLPGTVNAEVPIPQFKPKDHTPLADTRICAERNELLLRLAEGYKESPIALGLMADGGVIEVLVSPNGETFTMIVSYPRRPTCVVAVGKHWSYLAALTGQPV